MKHLMAIFVLALAGCSGDDACDLARENLKNVQKTDALGDSCSIFQSSGCSENFDTCAEGDCRFRSNSDAKVCTKDCDSDSECTGIGICYDGFCQPGATCDTFCDGSTCCTYRRSDTDPTQCVQVSCS